MKEIEGVVESCPPRDLPPGPEGNPGQVPRRFREEIMPVLQRSDHKTGTEGRLGSSFQTGGCYVACYSVEHQSPHTPSPQRRSRSLQGVFSSVVMADPCRARGNERNVCTPEIGSRRASLLNGAFVPGVLPQLAPSLAVACRSRPPGL